MFFIYSQIVKCDNVDCCGELRSDLKMILKNGLLPPPVQFVHDAETGRLRRLKALENVQNAHFLPLFQSIVVQSLNPTIDETLPYDFACPTIQGDVESGRRICKVYYCIQYVL